MRLLSELLSSNEIENSRLRCNSDIASNHCVHPYIRQIWHQIYKVALYEPDKRLSFKSIILTFVMYYYPS